MNQVFVCGTYFQIYVSILKVIFNPNKGKNLIIINDHTPQIESVIPYLTDSGYFDHAIAVPFRKIADLLKEEKGALGNFINRNNNSIRYVEQHSRINDFDDFIKDAELNLFYNWGLPSSYFILKYPQNYMRIIE